MAELGQCECEQYADICNDCFTKWLKKIIKIGTKEYYPFIDDEKRYEIMTRELKDLIK